MEIIKKCTILLLKSFGYLGLILLFYVFCAYGLSQITINSLQNTAEKPIEIFIKSNGVHTDIVLPTKNCFKDWTSQIKTQNTKLTDTLQPYLAFGWGDKGFYLNTDRKSTRLNSSHSTLSRMPSSA